MGLEKFIQAKKCFKKIANLYNTVIWFQKCQIPSKCVKCHLCKDIFYHNIFKLHEKIK